MIEEKKHLGRSYVEPDMVDKIAFKTGLSKSKIRKSLSVFRLAFKNYVKGPMDLPLSIRGVFTLYRGRYKKDSRKTDEQRRNWRESDNKAPYKK